MEKETPLKIKKGREGSWREGVGLLINQEESPLRELDDAQQENFILVEVDVLLTGFEKILEEPTFLPSHRKQDHDIPLEDGVKGLSLRPYIHSSTKKDVIEGMVQEMIQ